MLKKIPLTLGFYFCLLLLIFHGGNIPIAHAQKTVGFSTSSPNVFVNEKADPFGTSSQFIENIGQYGIFMDKFPEMGKILYAYEGFTVPVLFTEKGVIYLHRKFKLPTPEEREREERKGKKKSKESETEQIKVVDRAITMQWINGNENPEIIPDDPETGYHTYGYLPGKAHGFKKITYKNLYHGIDLVYSFNQNKNNGFEYSLIVNPGADPSLVKMLYGGDLRKINQDEKGNLVLKSGAGLTFESFPVTYYKENISPDAIPGQVKSAFKLHGKEISFSFPKNYDKSKCIVIDPFVSATSNLTGTGVNAGVAKDVDFDYAGNVYVTGGGNGSAYKLAKFDGNGVLQWTFSGVLSIPAWSFGTYYGGWVVDKNTGNVYLGQGFAPSGGHRVIRINTTGVYDNYITTANASFLENWKMYWSCNNGTPQILIAGGGTNSNINFGIISPPSTVISSLNVTGITYGTSGWAQDIADLVIDPATNALYTIYGSLYGTPSLANKIYKNNSPYSGASVAWNVASGFVSIQEIANRPYLVGPEIDNSANVFAINSSYLFYWDGKNLKAFDKTSGAGVGASLTLPANVKLMSGGIIADECNNVFVGSTGGTIKVYYFNGSSFDDAARNDISIPGFSGSAVFDLAYYEAQKILYASGNGFVSAMDIGNYNCSANSFVVNVSSSCGTLSATATVSPVPPPGSTITYVLFNGQTQIATNTTGIFSGLTPNVNYSIKATVNQACSGAVTNTSFTLPGPGITAAVTDATCGSANGVITITAAGGTAPYTYSKDGITFQPGNTFSSLPSGLYTITVKDLNNCSNTQIVNVVNANGPTATYTKTNAVCGSNTGTLTANGSGGVQPLTYSINGVNFQTGNFFTGILPGTYTLTVKDASGCTNVSAFTIGNAAGPSLSAVPSATYCNTGNGSINAVVSGGTAPYQYSINANSFQSSSVFNGLTAGSYTVTAKDSNNCLATVSVTVANSAAPTVTAVATVASCSNTNGSIQATGSGGVSPLVYSINGVTFQTSNFFGGLTPGSYIVTVKDVNNCTNTVAVNVTSTNGPLVTGTAVASACNVNSGTITAAGSGGTGLLQYSLNGVTYQSSTLFTGLAAGIYTLYVKDANGCLGGAVIIVPNSAAPSISVTVTPTACNLSNGIITVNGSGGTLPYQYSINGTVFQSGNVFTNVATGPYLVIIKDVNGCSAATPAVVTNVAGLSVTASVISSSCATVNGSITAIGSGGAAPLQYSINGVTYQSSNVFNSLGSGNYTVYVKDANNCISTTTAVINVLLAPLLTAVTTNATCAGANGTIVATGIGGNLPLQYSINGVTYQAGGTFLNVAPGVYTVYVKDASNCIQTTTVTITNSGAGPGISTFTVVTKHNYPCNTALGKITNPKVNGATCGSCTYSLNFGTFVPHSTQLFLNLLPGVYTVTAQDANGCMKTISVTIGNGVLSTATAVVTGTACNTSNGTITLTGIGPNTPYHASISGIGGPWITFDPTYTFTGLAPGTYTVTMADDESFDIGPPIVPGNCLTTMTVVVPSTGGPSISTLKYNGTCNLNDGTITATGSGGTPPLLYNINNGTYQAGGIFNNLGTGVYQVNVMDATGCINTKIDTLVNPTGPAITAVITPTSCGLNNGIITASGSGGTAPFQYSINGTVFQNSGVFTGLASGTYTVRVADASACISSANVTITSNARPTVTAFTIAANCNTSNGVISALGVSGKAPYQYSIDGGITYQSSNLFIGLSAGFYTVMVKDDNGCTNSTGVSVGNFAAPQVALISSPATCGNANGTITATGSGGIAPLQYSVNGLVFQSGNIFTGLSTGPYTIYVRDANGCQSTKNIVVTGPNGPQSLTSVITNASCGNSNGIVVATASGGVAPLQYSINGTTFQAATTFNLLAAGTYPLTVKDVNNCTRTLSVTIANLPGPSVTATSTQSSCFANDGTITALPAGGTGVITYSKNGVTYQSSNIFTALAPGSYTITAKDAKGCTGTTSVTVGKVSGPLIAAIDSGSSCGSNIVVNGNGGFSPYQFTLNNNVYQSNNIFACQLPGTYTVKIKDANGCIDSVVMLLNNPLPVEFLNFEARRNHDHVELTWMTVSEINCDYFTIEKSRDGHHFENVLQADAAGNSNIPLGYSGKDFNPFVGINYYRLKQTDFNGTAIFSKIIKLNFEKVSGYYLYPNPAIDYLTIVSAAKIKNLKIYDVTGRLIYESIKQESSEIKVDLTGITSGSYTLKITDAADDVHIYPFFKHAE